MDGYVGYEEYIAKFESDEEADADPNIKQLKYNAYFEDEEEPGWVILLPGFKPYQYTIKPLPEAVKKVDPGLQHHDQVVDAMRNLVLASSGKDKNRTKHNKRMRKRLPSVPEQSPVVPEPPEVYKYNVPFIYENVQTHKLYRVIKSIKNNKGTQ